MEALKQRLEKAITEGIQARQRYYDSIELDAEQELGEPAAEASIQKLESILGTALPPSYRAFLLLHNGWKEIDGGVDLVPLEELLGITNEHDLSAWKQSALDSGDDVAARSLVIGASLITATKYLLDPIAASQDGEWPLLQYHHEIEAEVPSFIEWLEDSVEEYLELAELDMSDDE